MKVFHIYFTTWHVSRLIKIPSYFLTGNLIRSLIQPTPWLMWHAHMNNSLTHRSHRPSNPQEEFLLKILKLRDLFAFYTSRKLTLFTQQQYFTENRKREKTPLTRWISNLIYSHMKNKSVKLPFITKNSKHLVRTICSQMKNKCQITICNWK